MKLTLSVDGKEVELSTELSEKILRMINIAKPCPVSLGTDYEMERRMMELKMFADRRTATVKPIGER